MTSGEAVKYKNSLDAFSQILKKEGAKSLFKGAGANILRAVAGAGVLAGYDKLQLIVFGKKYGSGGAWDCFWREVRFGGVPVAHPPNNLMVTRTYLRFIS